MIKLMDYWVGMMVMIIITLSCTFVLTKYIGFVASILVCFFPFGYFTGRLNMIYKEHKHKNKI